MYDDFEKKSKQDAARLSWACRRGMLELDILLNQFLKEAYPHCSAYEQAQFAELLTVEDTELFAWLMGKSSPKDKNIKKIIELIKNHVARTR